MIDNKSLSNMSFITSNISDAWLRKGNGFTYVKVAHEIIKQYFSTGKVTLSNDYFIRESYKDKGVEKRGAAIDRTERTVQWSFVVLERINLMKRKYADDTRNKRTEMKINEETLFRILSMKKKDIDKLDRDNPIKHILNQMPATVKPSKAKSILKRIKRTKDAKQKEKLIAQVAVINEQYKDYDDHITAIIEKNQKYMSAREVESDKKEQCENRIQGLREKWSSTLGISNLVGLKLAF